MSDQHSETAASPDAGAPQVSFGEVAEETVEESVAHEREITSAGTPQSLGTEPYYADTDADTDADTAADTDAGADADTETGVEAPTGDQVVNSITAAVRR